MKPFTVAYLLQSLAASPLSFAFAHFTTALWSPATDGIWYLLYFFAVQGVSFALLTFRQLELPTRSSDKGELA